MVTVTAAPHCPTIERIAGPWRQLSADHQFGAGVPALEKAQLQAAMDRRGGLRGPWLRRDNGISKPRPPQAAGPYRASGLRAADAEGGSAPCRRHGRRVWRLDEGAHWTTIHSGRRIPVGTRPRDPERRPARVESG